MRAGTAASEAVWAGIAALGASLAVWAGTAASGGLGEDAAAWEESRTGSAADSTLKAELLRRRARLR